MFKRLAVLGSALLAVACSSSDDPSDAQTAAQAEAQAQDAGDVVADSGFRPQPHGFSFQNWGGKEHPHAQLTADDAAYLFGEQVCARRQGDSCVPTPAAKLWIAEMNRATESGHCEGMAALSAAFYVKTEKVDEYGAGQAFALKPDDSELMRSISTYFSTQALEPVQSTTSATRGWSLQKIVDHLGTTLKSGDDYPTLGIYGTDGGHAVTPYRIEALGAGRYRIHVYDNNYPGAEKTIDVDAANNRWTYAGAALNPSEDPAPWSGGAGSMDVTLLTDRYQPLQCPFCGPSQAKAPAAKPAQQAKKPKPRPPGAQAARPKPPKPQVSRPKPSTAQAAATRPRAKPARKPATAAQGYAVITPSRCSQVQAVGKADKKQIRMGKTGARSQIAGASMRPMRGSRGCVVSLPGNQEYDVRLVDDGKPSSRPLTGVTVFAPGKVYSVSDVAIRPGKAETVRLGRSAFTYHAGSPQQPTVRVGGGNDSGNGYYEVSGLSLDEGYNFRAGEDEDGRVTFSGDDPELEAFDLRAELVGVEETVAYEYEDVDVGDDGLVLMDVGDDGGLEMAFDDERVEAEEFDEADFAIDEEDADLLDEEVDEEAGQLIDEEAGGESGEPIDEEADDEGDELADEASDGDVAEDDSSGSDDSEATNESDDGEADEEAYEPGEGEAQDASDEDEAEEAAYESDEGEAEEESYESDEGEAGEVPDESDAEEASYESDDGAAEETSYEGDEGEAEEASYESDDGEAEEESYESDEGEADEESYESDEGDGEEESYESDEGDGESYEDEDEDE